MVDRLRRPRLHQHAWGTLRALCIVLSLGASALGQIELFEPFDGNTATDLGLTGLFEESDAPFLQGPGYYVAGMFIHPDNPDVLYISAEGNYAEAALYRLPLERDENGRIVGVTPFHELAAADQEPFIAVPYIDGGLFMEFDGNGFDAENVTNVLHTTYHKVAQYVPYFPWFITVDGSDDDLLVQRRRVDGALTEVARHKVSDLTDASGTSLNALTTGGWDTTGGMAFVPGTDDRLVVTDFRNGNIALLERTTGADGIYSFEVLKVSPLHTDTTLDPDLDPGIVRTTGLLYIPGGTGPGFEDASLMIYDWGKDRIVVYAIDEDGMPILDSAQLFSEVLEPYTGLIDPISGDALFSYVVEPCVDWDDVAGEYVLTTGFANTTDDCAHADDYFEDASLVVLSVDGIGNPSALVVPIPTNVTVSPRDGALQVGFRLASGGKISGVEYSIDDGDTWTPSGSASPILIDGLSNGTTYPVRLRAVSSGALGRVSDATDRQNGTPTNVLSTPSAPTNLTATASSGALTIDFTPGIDGGSPITNHEWTQDRGATWIPFDPPAITSPVTLTGLENGTEMRIALRAVNAVGNGDASGSITVTPGTGPDAPTAPTNLSAEEGDGRVTITFTLGDGRGSPITNHQFTVNGGIDWFDFDPPITTSPATITDLNNGRPHSIALRTVTTNGVSPASDTLRVTPATTPSAPTNLTATPGDAHVTLTFTPARDGGSPITNHAWSQDGGATWTPFDPPVVTSPATIGGLTNGTPYTIRLRAINDEGDGAPSTDVTATPIAPGPKPAVAMAITGGPSVLANAPFSITITLLDEDGAPTVTQEAIVVTFGVTGGTGALRHADGPDVDAAFVIPAGSSSATIPSLVYATGSGDVTDLTITLAASADGLGDASLPLAIRTTTLTLTASPDTLSPDGIATTTITATLRDANGEGAAGGLVTIDVTLGTLLALDGTPLPNPARLGTDATGTARLLLRSTTEPGIATLTATCAGACEQATTIAFTSTQTSPPSHLALVPGNRKIWLMSDPGDGTILRVEYRLATSEPDLATATWIAIPSDATQPYLITEVANDVMVFVQTRSVAPDGATLPSATATTTPREVGEPEANLGVTDPGITNVTPNGGLAILDVPFTFRNSGTATLTSVWLREDTLVTGGRIVGITANRGNLVRYGDRWFWQNLDLAPDESVTGTLQVEVEE